MSSPKVKQNESPKQYVPTTHKRWSYIDPKGRIQGSFSDIEMREWVQAGYFKLTLQVALTTEPSRPTEFYPLDRFFPSLTEAFLIEPRNGTKNESTSPVSRLLLSF